LIGALNAAGVIGGAADPSSPPDTSTTAANRSASDAVLHGDWLVNLEVQGVKGDPAAYNYQFWGLEPVRGARGTETWTLDSVCADRPCETTWDSVETPDRFATLDFANGTYTATDDGHAPCAGVDVPVRRSIELHVTDAADLEGVWSGTAISGLIKTSWICNGQEIQGVLSVDGSAVPS
jgi:hypothetical protein